MRVAVVGAGLAGLGALWHLLQYPFVSAVLFDAQGIGGGASGVSTGLMHPFPGKEAKRSWRADEGIKASLELVEVAETALGRPVADRSGILRLALTEQQRQALSAVQDPDCSWWEAKKVREILPLATPAPGLWYGKGVAVYSLLYLQGLWQACEKKGATLLRKKVSSLDELADFDAVILANGAGIFQFEECKRLPLKQTKGQVLLCRWPEKLPFSLLSSGHITPAAGLDLCHVGSTYEREFLTAEPEEERALRLLEQVADFYPPVRNYQVLEVHAGIRVSPRMGHQPIVERIAPKAWVFTGLGSRGMVYHALLGAYLAKQVTDDQGVKY